ncbi:hypothetical protein HEP_00386500 [Hepatocystis sp. ex Piliocolobus tephrosceles]|nr:hypothetical protein HEP_00386500 [Hepatocystis sp. ex Piliocolobus tephrosceles]
MDCFLFENNALPTMNNFIILDAVIKMIKSRADNELINNKKQIKTKKTLYLTNKKIINAFPPNYEFILNFLNMLVMKDYDFDDRMQKFREKSKYYANKFGYSDGTTSSSNWSNSSNDHNSINDNNDNDSIKLWNIRQIKNYKKHMFKDIKYFKFRYKSKITIDELKDVLKYIDIKYIDSNTNLSKLLYKLNEYKKYNIIIINLAFFFIKDENLINVCVKQSTYCMQVSSLRNENNNNTTNSNNNTTNSNNNIMEHSQMDKILCNVFINNLLYVHFYYSCFVSFFKHLNNVSVLPHHENVLVKDDKKDKGMKACISSNHNYNKKCYTNHNVNYDRIGNDVNKNIIRKNRNSSKNNNVGNVFKQKQLNNKLNLDTTRKRQRDAGIIAVNKKILYNNDIAENENILKREQEPACYINDQEQDNKWNIHIANCNNNIKNNEERNKNNNIFIKKNNMQNLNEYVLPKHKTNVPYKSYYDNSSNNNNYDNDNGNNKCNEKDLEINRNFNVFQKSIFNTNEKSVNYDTSKYWLNNRKQNEMKKKKKKAFKNKIYIFDIIPKLETHRNMYVNITSAYFSYLYLITL